MFKPYYITGRITDITANFLKEHGIEGLLLDVDNTMTTAHASGVLKSGVDNWLKLMAEKGIRLMILSNAQKHRIAPFAEKLGLDFHALSAKPMPFGYLRAAKQMQLQKKRIAVVGDQIFTDVLGGKLAGVRTILVTDIVPEIGRSFRIRRSLEEKLLKRYGYERKKG